MSEAGENVKPSDESESSGGSQPLSVQILQSDNNGQFISTSTDPCTLTPITTVTTIGDDNQAALLFLLNSSNSSNQVETSTTFSGLSSYGSAVFVPQPITINLMSQIQDTSGKSTSNDSETNVIETAMDLANFGDMDNRDSTLGQHPIANAALTLVSLGSGQPVQEIVIDESGRSTCGLSHDANLEDVSVTVETEGSSQMISKSQIDNSSTCTLVTSTLPASYQQKTDTQLRDVVTQTGGGEGEVVVLKSSMKTLSSLLTEQSMERKRQADMREAQNQVLGKERSYACDKCEKKFFTKHDLKRHAMIHTDLRPFECETCKKSFRTSNELKLHIPVHNKDTPYKCEFCDKEFRTKGCFKSHIKYHIGDKRHKCTICDRAFVKSADLKRHVAAHNNEKNFKCKECDSAFTRRDNLKAHMLLHSRESVVTCDMCNKEFINAVYLKRHMHIHKQAKKKPYECQWCPKTYEQLEGLRRHIRQHVGDEKFVCEHCAKKFITAIQLKRHLWLSHEQNSPYRRSIL